MENTRVKVDAVGLYHCPAFGVYGHSREEEGIVEGRENGSLVAADEELEFFEDPVVEGKPHDMGLEHLYGVDMREPVGGHHGSGSIVPGTWLALAFSHAVSSSI
jgi:hypothetical protein